MLSLASVKRAAPYAVILAAGGYLYDVALHLDYTQVPDRIGPDAWPRIILVLLIALCAGQVIRLLFSRRPREAAHDPAQASPEEMSSGLHLSTENHPRLAWAGIALTFAYLLVFEVVGFFTASVAYLFVLMFVGGYRRPVAALVTSVVTALAFVFVFMKVVYISLPLGRGPFLEISDAVMKLLGIH